MTRPLTKAARNILKLLPRALAITLMISAPVLAVPSLRGDDTRYIDAPTMHNSGAGFVLMVSLQRG